MAPVTPTAQIQAVARELPRSAGDVRTWIASVAEVSRTTAARWLAMDASDPRPVHRAPPPTQAQADAVLCAQRALHERAMNTQR